MTKVEVSGRLRQVAERDDWTCWICEAEIDPAAPRPSPWAASIDHVVPRARGGGNDPENLRLAHRRCNGRRGSHLPELEWPVELQMLDRAPLWQTLRRALRRPGQWELVGVAALEEQAVQARAWVVEQATLLLGGAWESRCTALGVGHGVSLRRVGGQR